jgi:hypothetical protein
MVRVAERHTVEHCQAHAGALVGEPAQPVGQLLDPLLRVSGAAGLHGIRITVEERFPHGLKSFLCGRRFLVETALVETRLDNVGCQKTTPQRSP